MPGHILLSLSPPLDMVSRLMARGWYMFDVARAVQSHTLDSVQAYNLTKMTSRTKRHELKWKLN